MTRGFTENTYAGSHLYDEGPCWELDHMTPAAFPNHLDGFRNPQGEDMVHTDLDRDLVSIATEQGEPHRTQNESVTSEEMALRGVAKASGAQMRLLRKQPGGRDLLGGSTLSHRAVPGEGGRPYPLAALKRIPDLCG